MKKLTNSKHVRDLLYQQLRYYLQKKYGLIWHRNLAIAQFNISSFDLCQNFAIFWHTKIENVIGRFLNEYKYEKTYTKTNENHYIPRRSCASRVTLPGDCTPWKCHRRDIYAKLNWNVPKMYGKYTGIGLQSYFPHNGWELCGIIGQNFPSRLEFSRSWGSFPRRDFDPISGNAVKSWDLYLQMS